MAKENEEVEGRKKGGIKWLIILPLILIIAIGGGVGGTILTSKFMSNEKTETAKQSSNTAKISDKQVIVPVKKFLVNLANDGSGTDKYARVSLSLLVANDDNSKNVKKNTAVIRDSVINVLRQKKAGDILNSADSIPNLKNELKDSINRAYGQQIVQEVFVTDLVVQ
ncbi:flagellar biosynthesis protein FliL [Liquorilactobacillus sucicola DSM 21376 = JCM 15457]|uniref:Flagellar protein FliL n=2 Tax=Liquorilactobacillus sucicola TaxID=519050 RepID=A0A023CWT7_9LACO|nr:flagellar basal body-associated FliL family protein [Liquorilactobacillus sucicola]AJA34373.1 flagellar biosynthesis protein FliL [Liquorilactobacillus sucicola]KRN06845.1 flagellar biosynthesis protein FliL [Liquorilactobacillus sucicola DSM 21376 = JCM 15457]GAJ26322.1 flagellar biosynthesis protein FliL [Liquorilactobacillus sucicola DSM 21376 = JCM 15457]